MSSDSIANSFNHFFKIKLAKNKLLKQEAFKIRYDVYSRELGWVPENELELETDDYDDDSYHCLLEHRRTEVFAGCFRLVIPPVNNPSFKLPFEAHYLDPARANIVDSSALKDGSFSEVSRLAVLDIFRRRTEEQNIPFILKDMSTETVYTEEERRNFPNIALGLYLAAVVLADICNHQGVFVMMEPRLNKRLISFGLPFEQIGEKIESHRLNALFYLKKEHFTSELSEELLALYNIIYADLSQQISLIPFCDRIDKQK